VTLAAKGDRDAFSVLVDRYCRYVYAICHKVSLHEEDALDITQIVFMKLIETIHTFDGRGAFRPWLATIATHEAIDYLRSPSRRERPVDPLVLNGLADKMYLNGHWRNGEKDAREMIEGGNRKEIIQTAMASLPPQQRAIFTLHLMEDMRPKEIAVRLGIPAGQVSGQLRRAMARLREILAAERV